MVIKRVRDLRCENKIIRYGAKRFVVIVVVVVCIFGVRVKSLPKSQPKELVTTAAGWNWGHADPRGKKFRIRSIMMGLRRDVPYTRASYTAIK